MRYTVTFELPRVNSIVERETDEGIEVSAWELLKDRTLGDLFQGQTVRGLVVRQSELSLSAAEESADGGDDGVAASD